jgi:glutamate-1-semialdehyde 2,1-aminomutase
MILGHGHPEVVAAVQEQLQHGMTYGAPTTGETDLAQAIVDATPGVERLRLVNSGTEATMSALRVARGFTGREKVVKMAGCYHGHADFLLVKAGSGALTLGSPDSAGVTAGAAQDTLVAPHNDLAAVESLFEQHPGEIAAVILEPVVGNMGVVPPVDGYLEGLREMTTRHGALLVFDEVMTGFRVGRASAQGRYGVTPDLTCLGKVIGGGLPVGAYGGRADVMGVVAPEGGVYQAGTNSGNPLSVAAGLATLRVLARDPVHERLEVLGARLEAGLESALADAGRTGCVQRVGSMITLFFTDGPVKALDDIPPSAVEQFGAFWRAMRAGGVYLPPSQYEAWFISAAHDEGIIDQTVEVARRALA